MWKDWFGRLVLAGVGVSFLLVGLTGLTSPAQLMDPVQVQLGGISALSEIRAGYGGTHLALALLFLSGAIFRKARTTALVVAALFMTGLVAGRCLSFAIDGMPGPFVQRLFITELGGALAAGAALLLNPRPPPVNESAS